MSREKARLAKLWKQLRAEPRPHALAECARAFLAHGDARSAREVVEFGLSLFPTAEALKRAAALAELGESEDRLRDAKECVRTTGTPASYLELADAYRTQRRFDQCVETLVEAVERHPDNGTVLAMLGELRYRRFVTSMNAADGRAAEAELRRAAASDREALKPRFLLAELYARVGAFVAAREAAAAVLALAPEHERAAELLAALAPQDGHPAADRDDDLEWLLDAVEDRREFAGPKLSWQAAEAKPAAVPEHAERELAALAAESRARSAVYFDADGAELSTVPEDRAAATLRDLARLCDRGARGMELGVPTRLVMEGESLTCVLEMKQGAGFGLMLARGADAGKAATLARDSLERLGGS